MNTLIILLIIFYLVFSKLGRTARRTPAPPGPQETDFPVPADIPDYSAEDDAPLSGPWSRNGGAKTPSGRKAEKQAGDPVLMEPEPKRTGGSERARESAACKQQESGELLCPQGEPFPGKGQGQHKRCRKNPLAVALMSKSELVGSILVGEIIAKRGGLKGRRR